MLFAWACGPEARDTEVEGEAEHTESAEAVNHGAERAEAENTEAAAVRAHASEGEVQNDVPAVPNVRAQASTIFPHLNEAEVLRVLREGVLTEAAQGGGGRSVSFRVTLELDGQRVDAFFKPEQSTSSSRWRSEVAAFYLDRELGFGRVPPLSGRRLSESGFTALLRRHDRNQVVHIEDESLRGPVIWWIPGELRAWPLGQGWERYVRVEGALPVTPYQSPAAFRARASGRVSRSEVPIGQDPFSRELSDEEAAQLSDLIVFDFLISNVDRWGSDYTNVRRLELESGEHMLVFLDQGAGFWERDPPIMERRLEALQRFVPSTIEALRSFDLQSFRTHLAEDPLSPVLSDDKLNALEARVQRALEHIDSCLERFGDQALISE